MGLKDDLLKANNEWASRQEKLAEIYWNTDLKKLLLDAASNGYKKYGIADLKEPYVRKLEKLAINEGFQVFITYTYHNNKNHFNIEFQW